MTTPTIDNPLVELVPAVIDMTGFEEAFAEDIQCDHCHSPAVYRSFGHMVQDCGDHKTWRNDRPPYHKCAICYASWRQWTVKAIRDGGVIRCNNCKRTFLTPEAFSYYRKF